MTVYRFVNKETDVVRKFTDPKAYELNAFLINTDVRNLICIKTDFQGNRVFDIDVTRDFDTMLKKLMRF